MIKEKQYALELDTDILALILAITQKLQETFGLKPADGTRGADNRYSMETRDESITFDSRKEFLKHASEVTAPTTIHFKDAYKRKFFTFRDCKLGAYSIWIDANQTEKWLIKGQNRDEKTNVWNLTIHVGTVTNPAFIARAFLLIEQMIAASSPQPPSVALSNIPNDGVHPT